MTAEEMTTGCLCGLGVIGEQTDVWPYALMGGANSALQLVNTEGEVTLMASYTPWGDTLAVHGSGNVTFGYFGGVMGAATGLLYVGSEQYYDPSASRTPTHRIAK